MSQLYLLIIFSPQILKFFFYLTVNLHVYLGLILDTILYHQSVYSCTSTKLFITVIF